MAYPGEPEDFEYKQYVIEEQSNGRTALSKEDWRKLKEEDEAKKLQGQPTSDKTFDYANSEMN